VRTWDGRASGCAHQTPIAHPRRRRPIAPLNRAKHSAGTHRFGRAPVLADAGAALDRHVGRADQVSPPVDRDRVHVEHISGLPVLPPDDTCRMTSWTLDPTGTNHAARRW
jgi:hypothetical protein